MVNLITDFNNLPTQTETLQKLNEVLLKMRSGFYSEETGLSLSYPQDDELLSFLMRLDSAFEDPKVREFLHPNTPYTENPEVQVSTYTFWNFFANPGNQCFFMPAYEIDEDGNKKIVGVGSLMGVDIVDGLVSAERGIIVFNPEEWNRGYGGRIGITLMLWAKSVGIEMLKADTYSNNLASLSNLRRQMQGLGAVIQVTPTDDTGRGDNITFKLDLQNITKEQILKLL